MKTVQMIVMMMMMMSGVSGASLRPGFSVACRGRRSIEQMTETAEIVTEATVVDVSPARDSVYAVTLQVRNIFDVANIFDFKNFGSFK